MKSAKQDNKSHRLARNWLLAIGAIILLAIGMSWPTDYYIDTPGDAVPISQFVKSKDRVPNNFYLVTVSETSQPASVAELLQSYTDQYATRIHKSQLLGTTTNRQYQELQKWYMETSQQNAIYYAAKKAGIKAKLSYEGVYVMDVQKSSSFRGKLRMGDTVLGADGHKFHSTKEMTTYFRQKSLNDKLKIDVLRGSKKLTIAGKAVKVDGTGKPGIGIQLVERVKVTTHPELKIDAEDIGGPSAGLMFTLTSYQVFTKQNLAKGHKVAGTGTISADGKVGAIGGVDKKVVAADEAGAEVFFAPTDTAELKKQGSNYVVAKQTAKQIGSKMKVVPVRSFEDALNYLRNTY
ncbi:SepM family pheromone-processing serine protease [Lactobacillus xylocopicola]|uniref:endopeptidase La n=1 Tax=Lactobacillus xylocopicola TaxID=2976676 RepID=A0ABM8BGN7_9LACO|nr:SepM family pheromone-processing serine protease [Lactobacillus xylocopicola]BDR60429.1 peptide-binding protein [Lactobacillus xylocopicola]